MNNLPQGRYRYVKIDLTEYHHVDTGTPLYLKNEKEWEVTPTPIGPFVGICLPTMDIRDTHSHPQCTWPRWISWLWRIFHRVSKYEIGPIRYFFVQVSGQYTLENFQ